MTRSLHFFSWWYFLLQYFFTLQPPRDVGGRSIKSFQWRALERAISNTFRACPLFISSTAIQIHPSHFDVNIYHLLMGESSDFNFFRMTRAFCKCFVAVRYLQHLSYCSPRFDNMVLPLPEYRKKCISINYCILKLVLVCWRKCEECTCNRLALGFPSSINFIEDQKMNFAHELVLFFSFQTTRSLNNK